MAEVPADAMVNSEPEGEVSVGRANEVHAVRIAEDSRVIVGGVMGWNHPKVPTLLAVVSQPPTSSEREFDHPVGRQVCPARGDR